MKKTIRKFAANLRTLDRRGHQRLVRIIPRANELPLQPSHHNDGIFKLKLWEWQALSIAATSRSGWHARLSLHLPICWLPIIQSVHPCSGSMDPQVFLSNQASASRCSPSQLHRTQAKPLITPTGHFLKPILFKLDAQLSLVWWLCSLGQEFVCNLPS